MEGFSEKRQRNLVLKKEFLYFLDCSKLLEEIKIAGSKYRKIVNHVINYGDFPPPFRFRLKIDLFKIRDISYNLYELIVKEPKKSIEMAEELVFVALQELSLIRRNITQSDVQVVFDLISIPIVCFNNNYFHVSSGGLKVLNGILIGRTTVCKYTKSSVYFCKCNKCPNSNGVRKYLPHDGICSLCYCQPEEDIRSRDVGEEITAQFIPSDAFKKFGYFQQITVKVRDELTSSISLRIGQEYNFIGVNENNYLLAWNINNRLAKFEILSLTNDLHSLPIPSSVRDVYYLIRDEYPSSPWSFVGVLASGLGSHIVPTSSFLHLKIALMLSLATQNCEDPPVPIVAVGPDDFAAQVLINSAGKLAERFINYSTASELGGNKRQNTDEIWYEAGTMIFATNGVCNLGNWARFKREQCNYICRVIEGGRIILNGKDNTDSEAEFIPLKASLWTYWCHLTSKSSDQSQLKTLLNVFGMPFIAEENSELEIEKQSLKILRPKLEKSSSSAVPTSELKEFIALINSRQLCLQEAASELIRDFFVLIRRERPECVPAGAIKTITSLAEAHARLSLRNEILYEDVVAVLYLYNLSVSILFSDPLILCESYTSAEIESIPNLMHANIQNFKNSLEDFMKSNFDDGFVSSIVQTML